MAFDLMIKNGTVIDGTGVPGYAADLAVRDGRIVAIGKLDVDADRVIDAAGRAVAPGFIDPHTHYDAQIWWDPVLRTSSVHGVTTVILGNCGVGLAPCPPGQREILLADLTNVEGIPLDLLERGVTWQWETFPELLDAAEKRPFAVNLGFFAPLSPFRHMVMGEDSMERGATPDETATIAALLKEAVAAGAFGFSSSNVRSHVGYKGRPFASRLTSNDEFRAYCHVLRELGRGVIEIALVKVPGRIAEDEVEMLDLLLTESQAKVTYTSLFVRDDFPDAHLEMLERIDSLSRRGALPQVTPRPLVSYLDPRNPFLFSHFDCAHRLFNRPAEEQLRVYADPDFRKAFKHDLTKPSVTQTNWSYYVVEEVTDPALKPIEGLTVAEIARRRGQNPVDVFFDLIVEDRLDIRFTVTMLNGQEDRIADFIADPRVMLGLSDGGAHIDQMCDAAYPTYLLGKWVREKKVMSLERAVQRMTSEPADFFGIKDRGRLKPGKAADIVIFDPDTVNSTLRAKATYDLPGGARQMMIEPTGIDFTIVNGQVLFEAGRDTNARAGRVLRSGNA